MENSNKKPLVVVTRFNLAVKYRYPKLYKTMPKKEFLWLDEEYLAKRFELFENYTLPSFLQQTTRTYRWIVMFHKDTPDVFKKRIEIYREKLPEFEPWYLDDDESEHFVEILNDEFQNRYSKTGVISVRVDNDDAVHKTFIESIHNNLDECDETSVLSFRNGLQYDVRSKRCMRYMYINNHFISFYASPGNINRNIFSFQHPDVDKVIDSKHKIVRKSEIPLWVEIVHGTNCVNEIWCRPSKVFVPYSVKQEYPNLSLKWSTRLQWIWSMISYLPLATIKMLIDIIRLMMIFIDRKHA